MTAVRFAGTFDTIYATDLTYAADCWKLCGDAHCCNFSRYRSQMGITTGQGFQELPLLPGEMDYLRSRGFDRDFGAFEHRVVEFEIDRGTMKIEFLVSRGKACACQHDTRTTVCRLYPLMPRFDDDGQLCGMDDLFGMFEHIERLDTLPRACRIDGVSFSALNQLLTISHALASHPVHAFYLKAFELAKHHATKNLRAARAAVPAGRAVSTFRLFQGLYTLRQLIDAAVLREELNRVADRFAARFGDAFSLS